ncbi:MAG TPA: nuclear transport factor 2 family protein [Ktedonobacterales bacterium]|nr:nuclear transport factor 2 family protein [Ktedonobacterales bacterium]
MATETSPVAIARSFTQAWTSHDMETAASYLAADVVFDGPAGHSVGADAYLKGLQAFASTVSGLKLLAALGDDTQALIMYEVTTPAGTLTCAEHLTFTVGGTIQTDRLTFAQNQAPAN